MFVKSAVKNTGNGNFHSGLYFRLNGFTSMYISVGSGT